MKTFNLIFASLLVTFLAATSLQSLKAQDATANSCDQLYLDFEKGTLNGVSGAATMEEVKQFFPCFTGETEENMGGSNCGGGVFYLNHDFFIYTGRDYINVRNKFKGKLTTPILGKASSEALSAMGEPDSSFVYTDEFFGEETTYLQYAKDWGTLVVVVKDDTVHSLELFYGKKIGEIEFCF